MKSSQWVSRVVQVLGRLRPEAEIRQRSRYYVFELIAWVAQGEQPQQEEKSMKPSLQGKAAALLAAGLWLAAPTLAEEPAATPPPPTSAQVQQQLQQQQARILELERLLKE